MESIIVEKELSLYNLDGKWNDYIGVQKEVLQVLRRENFFVNSEIINKKTGMNIKINAKGIKESLGTGRRFQALLAELIADDIENIHEENGYMFAYLGHEIMIDGKLSYIRISIKKKMTSNWFWIHNIDEKSPKLLDPSNRIELKEI